MAKKDDIQEAGKAAVGGQGPEKSAVTKIEMVEDLEACYPQLVSKIKDETVEFIRNRTALQIKEKLPELYQRIVMDIQSKSGPDLNVPGFLLEVDDPVARGTLRAYQKLKGFTDLRLPYVLPYKDKNTKAALENYILRADGCGDRKRAEAGRAAMKKIK